MDAPTGPVKDGKESELDADELRVSLVDVTDRAFKGERFRVSRYGRRRIAVIGDDDYERFLALERAAAEAVAAREKAGRPARRRTA